MALDPLMHDEEYQDMIIMECFIFVNKVKQRYRSQPWVYEQYISVMLDFRAKAIDTPELMERVTTMFAGQQDLIAGFIRFLPPGKIASAG